MLQFTPILLKDATRLYKYYKHCTYHLCEYSAGVKLMWRHLYHYEYAEACGCLVVCHQEKDGSYVFEVPVPLPKVGDVDAALDQIDEWCIAKGVMPVFFPVPVSERERLMSRYPYVNVENVRLWQDYLYHAEDLSTFAGRRYSGQRNHINKFRKLYGDGSRFVPLSAEDKPRVEEFWEEYHVHFNKDTILAKKEVCYARRLTRQIGKRWVKAGAIELDGKGIAIAIPLSSIASRKVYDRLLTTIHEEDLTDTSKYDNERKQDMELIVAIYAKGNTDEIMKLAREAGATGGTIVKAKGTARAGTDKFFGMSISDEKEILYIVAKAEDKSNIMKAIAGYAYAEGAHPVAFSLPITESAGFRLMD